MGANEVVSDRFRQIQEIILGEYSELWDQRFQALEKSIKDLARKTDKRFNELHEALQASSDGLKGEVQNLEAALAAERQAVHSRLDALKSELETQIDALRQGKIDHEKLGEFLIQWGRQVKG